MATKRARLEGERREREQKRSIAGRWKVGSQGQKQQRVEAKHGLESAIKRPGIILAGPSETKDGAAGIIVHLFRTTERTSMCDLPGSSLAPTTSR